jgi:heme-degrading monooxygenase HmoA
MIARTSARAARAADADAYLAYLNATGHAAFAATPGNRGALTLRRLGGDRAEFLVISLWESEDAVRAFAGNDIGRAVFYPEDDRFLVARDEHVTHYEVVHESAVVGS